MSKEHPFDFETSQIPQMKPLENSYANNDFEKEIKDLFIDLFKTHLGEDTFNAFVLGAQNLGSYSLVQRSINADGLVLIKSDVIEASTRYLYRTWKSGDVQKRGLHITRMYLHLLFGDHAEVTQLQQPVNEVYPAPYFLEEYSSEKGLKDGYFLTSRINLDVDFSLSDQPVKQVLNSIQSVIPAKFVPELRFINVSTVVNLDLKCIQFGQHTINFDAEGELRQTVKDVYSHAQVNQVMKPKIKGYLKSTGHIQILGEE